MDYKILIDASHTSVSVTLFKNLCVRYSSTKLWLDKIYNDSQTRRLIRVLWEGTKINFRYSFLGRLTEIKEGNSLAILDNSNFVTWLLTVYNLRRYKIKSYFKPSVVADSKDAIVKELYLLPVKTGSIILVTAIITNILFSVLLNKKIGFLGWTIKILFLFIGLSGLFCNVAWQDLKKTSHFLKHINNS